VFYIPGVMWVIQHIEKNASTDDRSACEHIMRTIYQENPGYWPYGLTLGHLDGGCWLVKDAQAQPIGFVGWQERNDGIKKIGYYAIGILPEFRHQRYGRAAVQELLKKKASGVDEVRALIVDTNAPSRALAASLQVPQELIKSAAPAAKQGLGALAKSLLPMGLYGAAYGRAAGSAHRAHQNDTSFLSEMGRMNPELAFQDILNFAIGAGAKHSAAAGLKKNLQHLATPLAWTATTTAIPAKDAIQNTAWGIPGFFKDVGTLANKPAPTGGDGEGMPTWAKWMVGAGVPVTALAALYMAGQKQQGAAPGAAPSSAGKIRVTLPTRNKDDAETALEVPFEEVGMSNTLQRGIRRDLLRRLRAETAGRTRRKFPREEREVQALQETNVI
jgi:hypothetical protein